MRRLGMNRNGQTPWLQLTVMATFLSE